MTQALLRCSKPILLLLLASGVGLGCAHGTRPADPLEPEFAGAAAWKFGEPNEAWVKVDERMRGAARDEQFAAIEKQLILILRTSPSTDAKRQTCRRLAKIGGEGSIPALATALTDPALTEDARGALQAIPDRDAERVLIHALKETSDGARIGVINSLGARRDPLAIRALGKQLKSADPQTQLAAAHALGLIGSRAAMRRLAKAFPQAHAPLQAEIIQALLVDADRLAEQSYTLRATKIYEQLYLSKQTPTAIRLAALQGLATLAPERWLEDVLARAGDPHPKVAAPAARILAQMPWTVPVAQRAVEKIPAYPPASRALVLLALGDRGDPAVRTTAMQALNDEDQAVRFAALAALASLGAAADVPTLVQVAAEGPDEQRAAAAETLSRLRADGVDHALATVALDSKLTESEHCRAVEALAARDARGQASGILTLAQKGNPAEQLITLKALAQIAPAEITTGGSPEPVKRQTLLAILEVRLAAPTQEVAAAADAAYVAVAQRIPEPEKRDDAAAEAYGSADNAATQIALVELMGSLGGDQALEIVLDAQRSGSTELSAAAGRALTHWPSAAAIPTLLALAESGPDEKQKILAAQAVIRLADTQKEQAAAQRIGWLRQVMQSAQRPAEQRAALATAAGIPDDASLAFVTEFIGNADVGPEASAAATRLLADPAVQSAALKQAAQAQLDALQK